MKADSRRDLSKNTQGLVHEAAGACVDCLQLLLSKNSHSRQQYLMQVNNYNEKVQPLHFAAAAKKVDTARLILENIKSQPVKNSDKGKSEYQKRQKQ